jgi:hypothetical protein
MKLDRLFRCLALAASLCLAPVHWACAQNSIGGVPPGYQPKPHDPMLTEVARTGLPVIAALDRYRAEKGSYPPPESFADVRRYLPAGVTIVHTDGSFAILKTGPGIREWIYTRAMPEVDGYGLSAKLGWDPELVYRRNGADRRWVFVPGDGAEERVLDLTP